MPLYEYLCQACDARFEAYVRAWAEPVSCPACRGVAVEKLVSSFAVSSPAGLSGSGGGGCGCGRGGCGCH